MTSRILAATDLSESSSEALRWAHERAKTVGAPLAVCHVLPNVYAPAQFFPGSSGAAAQQLLEAETEARIEIEEWVAQALGSNEFELFVERGEAYPEIVRRAEAWRADLVVVGSHGRTGLQRVLLGSVAGQVVRYAACPVLVARSSRRTGVVVAATDLSDPSLPAIAAAVEEARLRGSRLVLVHALDLTGAAMAAGLGGPLGAVPVLPSVEVQAEMRAALTTTLEQALARYGATGEVIVADGAPAAAIVRCAEAVDAELLVVGTRGRTGLSRVVLGSVAERVIGTAHCSVLAVRQAS